MNAPLTQRDQLIASLTEMVRSDSLLSCVSVKSVNDYLLHACEIDGALLTLPLQGCKRASEGGQGDDWLEIRPGELFVIPNARVLDIANVPDPRTGEYLAIAIPLCEQLLDMVRYMLPEAVTADRGRISTVSLDGLAEPLLRWAEAAGSGRRPQAYLALAGVVVQLCEMGCTSLLAPTPPRLCARIRTMIAGAPARDWCSADFEQELGISGPTLRRRLAEEGTGLRELIADARLSSALQMLLASRLPVKTVAARVGYASTSSFVKRFSARYGVEPSRVSAAA
ncbi:MAG: AraC family transcriptional regulator [Moraxellaceae bacterium]|nr:AraC family transcriptional regulator [Moraxellaceae bacterium]